MPETIARGDGDGWHLSGRKVYSTGSPALAYGLVFARTDKTEPRIGNFFVPMAAEGVRIAETWDHLGLRASGSHDVVFTDVTVPWAHAVDLRPLEGWRVPDPLQQAWSCGLLAALDEGVARAAQGWFGQFLRERTPGSLGAPLASLPRFHEAFGENERLLTVAHRLTGGVAEEVDGGHPPQRMLTLTLRNLERDGLVTRTVTPSIPPRVDYELTDLGHSLAGPIQALGAWTFQNLAKIDAAQALYDARRDAV